MKTLPTIAISIAIGTTAFLTTRALLTSTAPPSTAVEVASPKPPPPSAVKADSIPPTTSRPRSAKTLAEILRTENSPERRSQLHDLIEALDFSVPGEFAIAKKALEAIPASYAKSSATRIIVAKLIEHDISAARKWAESLPLGNSRDAAFGQIVYHDSKDDPEAVFDYLDQIGWKTNLKDTTRPSFGVDDFYGAIDNAFKGYFERGDIQTALKRAAEMPDAKSSFRSFGIHFIKWAEDHPSETLQFLEEAKGMGARGDLTRNLVEIVASANPDALLPHLMVSQNPTLKKYFSSRIASTLAKSDPQSAAALVTESPDLFGSSSYSAVFNPWFRKDPENAIQWLSDLPPGNGRDSATRSLVANISYGENTDLPAAIQWAETISDPKKREEVFQMIEERRTR